MRAFKEIVTIFLCSISLTVIAQENSIQQLQNVVNLSATRSVEVQQDLLSISMSTVREGTDPLVLQAQLKSALDAALTIARAVASPSQLDVKTGNFSLYPRYGKNDKAIGWQGTTELLIEGKDFARISATAGKIQTLTLGNVSFGLSREQRAKAEIEAQSQAIARFKIKAMEVAKDFGFTSYTLREVSVNANEQGFNPRLRSMAVEARAIAPDASIPVEAGRSTVLITVAGSIQLK